MEHCLVLYFVTNTGEKIKNLSGGMYQINLGISIVDQNNNVIELDYLHKEIEKGGSFDVGETVSVSIELTDLAPYVDAGDGIRFEIVQEGVAWIDSTAVYYRP